MLRHYLSSVHPGVRYFPVSHTDLAGFITHLFAANYTFSTILSTVSAISYSHKIVGLADPADNVYIRKLLVGVHKTSRTMDLRRPIDQHMLALLVRAAKSVISDKYLQRCTAAMFMLAFHGVLRIGEITVRPGVLAAHVIKRSNLLVVPARDQVKSSLQLTIQHAKHQHRPIVLEINSQSHNCPVVQICRYLRTRGSSPGPLFVFPDKTPISRTYFSSQLSACLSHAGYDPSLYKCHSFRIGAATTAATRGYTHRCADPSYGQVEICCFHAIYPDPYDDTLTMFTCQHLFLFASITNFR